MDFRDKRIVITGASAGIGHELALALAREGAKLALASRDIAALEETVALCVAAGGEALAVRTDVTDEQACKNLIDAAMARFGGIDVLVNNAGMSMWSRFDEVTDLGIFERLIRVNYLGAVYCTHFALPYLKPSRGLIVAVSSLTGKTGVPIRSGYSAAKHAMYGFFESLRIELAGSGVDVTLVAPSFVATDGRARALGGDGKPLGKSPRREDINTQPVEACVRKIVAGMRSRRREVLMTVGARLAVVVKALAPTIVDRMAANSTRAGE